MWLHRESSFSQIPQLALDHVWHLTVSPTLKQMVFWSFILQASQSLGWTEDGRQVGFLWRWLLFPQRQLPEKGHSCGLHSSQLSLKLGEGCPMKGDGMWQEKHLLPFPNISRLAALSSNHSATLEVS